MRMFDTLIFFIDFSRPDSVFLEGEKWRAGRDASFNQNFDLTSLETSK